MRTRAQTTEPSALDLAFLATAFELEQNDLQILLDAPTTELVRNFLLSLTDRGQEIDVLKTEKLKANVELEAAVRNADAKVKAQKASVLKHAKEVEELRVKLNEAEAARETLATELESLRSTSSGSAAETQTLHQRIETLEAINRDTLALVESKTADKDRLANDLSEQHSKLLALRKEVNQLVEQNQSLENAASTQKFKEQSLQQEIELLKRNNDWQSTELQTRNQEHTKFRKERNARIASLQRELEDSNSAVEALKRTETTLRQRLDEIQAKADDAFARIASLQEDAARKEQDLKAEVNSSKRLAELQAQNAATHKARLHEVQSQVDQIKEDAADEIGRLQAEIETERSDKEDAERKVAELELSLEQQQQQRPSRAVTPMRNGNEPVTPMRGGSRAASPSVLPGSMRKIVGGLSFTQLYTQFTEAKEELVNERRRTDKLSEALDELVTELESRKPELEELRGEQDRLENEVLDYSRLLDESNGHRDGAIRDSERWQGEAEAAAREGQILRQQLRDLSVQIKILLVELHSRDHGIGELSSEERLELQRAARGEVDDASLVDMTTTGRLISQRLVIFRNVSELQDQNEKLLRLTRELGEQMEGDEAREKARQSAADAEELESLRQQVGRYKEELQTTATQIDSYIKERDMFRRMLQFRGQLAPDADMSVFAQSIPPTTPARNGMQPPSTPRSKDIEDLNKLLKEQQVFFDQYRNESSEDRRLLKDQADSLSREKNTLLADLARVQSKLTLAEERHEMLQANFAALRTENGELQKRSQQMAENAAKQDLRTQQVAEELVEARSMTESLRNENANAKAEKELWKRIETRLTEDNKTLMDERGRLNKLVTDLQNLQNERELAESESRRRLQGRAEALETELSELKRKLDAEQEENKKAALRREYDESQNRTRIDDLVKSLGIVREELVAAKTTRDQLQTRVDELKIDLRSAEEKVTALQPRPTPRPDSQAAGAQQENGNETELPAEQRLAVEVSDLRRELDLSKAELVTVRQQVEQFRAIAQSTEEELANFTQTADQFKEDSDLAIAEKEAKISELEQRVEDILSELNTTNQALSELRAQEDNNGRLLSEQKASFESELVRLRDDAERYAEEKKLYQGDLKAQAEIAQQAQQSYEDELVKHAEAAKALQLVRKEHNELRTEVAGIKSECEAAKVSLEQGEESWLEQRSRLEQEIAEASRRRHDLDEQNKLLHQQMEAFSTELTTLRQSRVSAGAEAASTGSSEGNLQEVIKFLRREKEIVDVQHELSVQETKRLQQQLDYANNSLEEARQKLLEERQHASDKSNTESSTNKLAQTINELNLFRESSTTLRNEARQAREKLEEKAREVERLTGEVDPLKARIGELEGEVETKEGEVKLLQDDRDHWRERTQNIISKYDRVDPAEIEEMKRQLNEANEEKTRLETEQVSLQEQITTLNGNVEEEKSAVQALNARIERFKVQAKDQDRKRTDRIRDISAEKDSVSAELEQAKEQLTAVGTELEQTKAELEQARAQAAAGDQEEGQVNENETEDSAQLQTRVTTAEAQAAESTSRVSELNSEVESLQARINELEARCVELESQLAQAQTGTSDGQQTSIVTDSSETLEKLRQELATAQQEVETLRVSSTAPTDSAEGAVTESGTAAATSAQQVSDEVNKLRSELESQHQLAISQMEEATKTKIENLKNSLKRQLRETRDKWRSEIEAELSVKHSAEIQQMKDEHNAAIEALKAAHQIELDKLAKDGAVAVTKAEGEPEVKAEVATSADGASLPNLSDDQVKALVKTNQTVRSLIANNLRSQVDKQTEKLNAIISAKDQEIATLKAAIEKAPSADDAAGADTVTKEELERQLEAARKEKDAAVRQAIDNAEKKTKVQISQRDMAQAKLAVVRQAATDTPTKPVKEVWDVANQARPAPKPAPAAAPAAASPKAAPSPAPASSAPVTQTPEQIEQEKLRARQERFGIAAAPSSLPAPVVATGSFGQPSTTPSTFGQPSAAPNPQAATFVPTPATRGTGIPSAGGASRLPSIRGGRKPSISGGAGAGVQIQGAAAPRGGLQQSGLPRGGAANARGAPRGRGGAAGANAGQKRALEGADGGGDAKRTRGGAAGGAASAPAAAAPPGGGDA